MDGMCGYMMCYAGMYTVYILIINGLYDLKFDLSGCADRDTVDVGSI